MQPHGSAYCSPGRGARRRHCGARVGPVAVPAGSRGVGGAAGGPAGRSAHRGLRSPRSHAARTRPAARLVVGQSRAVRPPPRPRGRLPGRRGQPRSHPRRAIAVRQPQPVAARRSGSHPDPRRPPRPPGHRIDGAGGRGRLLPAPPRPRAVAGPGRPDSHRRHRGRVLEPAARHRADPRLLEVGPRAGARPGHGQEPPSSGQRHGGLRPRSGHQRDRRGGGVRVRARHPLRRRSPPGPGVSPRPTRTRVAVTRVRRPVGHGGDPGGGPRRIVGREAVRRARPGTGLPPGLFGGGRASVPAGPGHAERLPRAPWRAALHRPAGPVADPRRYARIGRYHRTHMDDRRAGRRPGRLGEPRLPRGHPRGGLGDLCSDHDRRLDDRRPQRRVPGPVAGRHVGAARAGRGHAGRPAPRHRRHLGGIVLGPDGPGIGGHLGDHRRTAYG